MVLRNLQSEKECKETLFPTQHLTKSYSNIKIQNDEKPIKAVQLHSSSVTLTLGCHTVAWLCLAHTCYAFAKHQNSAMPLHSCLWLSLYVNYCLDRLLGTIYQKSTNCALFHQGVQRTGCSSTGCSSTQVMAILTGALYNSARSQKKRYIPPKPLPPPQTPWPRHQEYTLLKGLKWVS